MSQGVVTEMTRSSVGPRPVTAWSPMTCLHCGEAINKGDLAIWYVGAGVWHKTCPGEGNDALRAYRRKDGLIVLVETGEPPPSGEAYVMLWEE